MSLIGRIFKAPDGQEMCTEDYGNFWNEFQPMIGTAGRQAFRLFHILMTTSVTTYFKKLATGIHVFIVPVIV